MRIDKDDNENVIIVLNERYSPDHSSWVPIEVIQFNEDEIIHYKRTNFLRYSNCDSDDGEGVITWGRAQQLAGDIELVSELNKRGVYKWNYEPILT